MPRPESTSGWAHWGLACLLLVIALVLGLAPGLGQGPRPLLAEPYLSLRTGLKCSQCHVNRTGGGGRNGFGSAWAQTALPWRTVEMRDRRLNDWIAVGTDFRGRASVLARRPRSTPNAPRTAFDVTEAQVQVEARFIPGVLALYIDETIGPGGASTREAFGLVERLPFNGYAKAGRFMPPFGWRLWDDEAFIRSQTGFTYQTPDVGVELGVEPGPLSWSMAVTNGSFAPTEANSGKMVTSRGALVYRAFRAGASGSVNYGTDIRRGSYGGFGGFSLGPLVLLGEADWVTDSFETTDRKTEQFVGYIEGDLALVKGWNVRIAYDYHDPNLDRPEDHRIRWRGGLEVFPISFVHVSASYVRLDNAGDPNDRDVINLVGHLHF